MGQLVNTQFQAVNPATDDTLQTIVASSSTVASVTAAKLTKTGTPSEEVILAAATTDYPAVNAMPAGTKYVCVYCSAAVIVAMGEVTSATVGVYVAAGNPTVFPVIVTGVADSDKPHAQTATAGSTIRFTYLKD